MAHVLRIKKCFVTDSWTMDNCNLSVRAARPVPREDGLQPINGGIKSTNETFPPVSLNYQLPRIPGGNLEIWNRTADLYEYYE